MCWAVTFAGGGGPWANRAGRSAALMSLALPMSTKSFCKGGLRIEPGGEQQRPGA